MLCEKPGDMLWPYVGHLTFFPQFGTVDPDALFNSIEDLTITTEI